MDDDLKFGEAVLDQSYRSVPAGIRSQPLKPVAEAFVANIDRVVALLKVPLAVYQLSVYLNVSTILASHELFGTADKLIDEPHLTGEARFLEAQQRLMIPNADHISNRMRCDTEAEWRALASSVALMIPAWGKTGMAPGFGAVLSGAIIGTWTACETLAGDLWEEALNAEPGTLAKLKGRGGTKSDDTEGSKKIDLNIIHKYKFDLKSVMGTVLRKDRSFTTLDGIREAYRAAFSKDGDSVIGAVSDTALFRLSCVRNVIVHKAGIADEEFTRKMKSDADFSGVPVGHRVPIDGQIARSLIEPAVKCGTGLIVAVDEWLISHPGNPRGDDPILDRIRRGEP